jgi:molybdopterin converting factor small subunit
MGSARPVLPYGETGASSSVVTVRYWAAARSAAEVAEEQLSGSTVSEILHQARAARPDNVRFAHVLSVSSLLLGDRPVNTLDLDTVAVADGDVIEVLPPFAGG